MNFGRMKLKISKHSPEILMVVGIASIVGGIVTACKATLSVEDVLDKHRERRDGLKAIPEMVNPAEDVEYPETAQKKDLAKLYLHTGLDFAKLYALPVGLTALGITSLLASNRILKARYVGAVAAYNSVSDAFRRYRKNVIEDKGEEKDKEYLYGKTKKKTVEQKVLNDKGVEVYESTQAYVFIDGQDIPLSEYCMMYARGISSQWDSNADYNRSYIGGAEKWFTNILRDRGYVFLNEVYEWLGFPMTQAGSIIGWIYEPSDGLDAVDEVKFDVYEVWLPEVDDKGRDIHEPAYYIDFSSLSGIIFDKI